MGGIVKVGRRLSSDKWEEFAVAVEVVAFLR